jgi:hypothetical protein
VTNLRLAYAVLSCASLFLVVACSPDDLIGPGLHAPLKSALLQAPGILSRAENGTLGRGEQDRLVRLERQLPGFGGLYLDNGNVKVYMKATDLPLSALRGILAQTYSAHPNARIREVMAGANSATVIQGSYSLSELIAIQNRVESAIPGWTGVGTNIMENKVVISFKDSAAMESGLAAMEAAGIPTAAVTADVSPPLRGVSSYFTDYVRPIRDGLLMFMSNDTYRPHTIVKKDGIWIPYYYGAWCSIGFNVTTSFGDYFMTAGHCANSWRGQNGMVGDTVFQSDRGAPPYVDGFVGTIVWNIPWIESPACPINLDTFKPFDFCTNADVAFGQYTPDRLSTYGDRRIATSYTAGINGYPGSNQINNFYPITAELSPEYVDKTMRHQVAKSGGTTFTTSGPFITDMGDYQGTVCWATSAFTCIERPMLWMNQAKIQADVAEGDSGGAVFTGFPNNGAPYAAMGIVSAARIPLGQLPENRCISCFFIFSRWDQIELRYHASFSPRT